MSDVLFELSATKPRFRLPPKVRTTADEVWRLLESDDWHAAMAVAGKPRWTWPYMATPPSGDHFHHLRTLRSDPVLNLGVPESEWRLACACWARREMQGRTGWAVPAFAVALLASETYWEAFVGERNRPGQHPELRDGWAARSPVWNEDLGYLARHGRTALGDCVAALSSDARRVLGTVHGLAELDDIGVSALLDGERLNGALEELIAVGLASAPAEDVALIEMLSVRQIQDVLSVRGVASKARRKRDLIDIAVQDGATHDLVDLVVRTYRWERPVHVGMPEPEGDRATELASIWRRAAEPRAREKRGASASGTTPPLDVAFEYRTESPVRACVANGDDFAILHESGQVGVLSPDLRPRWIRDLHARLIESYADRYDYPADLAHLHDILPAQGELLVHLRDRAVCLAVDDGEELWDWEPELGEICAPGDRFGDVCFQRTSQALEAFEWGGANMWAYTMARPEHLSSDGLHVVTSRRGSTLHIIDVATGRRRHRISLQGLPRSFAPLVSQGLVVLHGTFNSEEWLAAIDAFTGEELWGHPVTQKGSVPSQVADAARSLTIAGDQPRRAVDLVLRALHRIEGDGGWAALARSLGPDNRTSVPGRKWNGLELPHALHPSYVRRWHRTYAYALLDGAVIAVRKQARS